MSRRARSAPKRPVTAPSSRPDRQATDRAATIWVALSLYIVFGLAHALLVPVLSEGSLINAPDEVAHIGYVRAIAEGHRLPSRNDDQFPTYQWHQPPLYYAIAAAGAPLGPTGMRLISLVFGALSLVAVLATVRLLFPGRPATQALAVGLCALLPMRHAVTASVGNDSATELAFTTSLYLVARLSMRGWSARDAVLLGTTIGAGILTKASCVLLLPLGALAGLLVPPRPAFRAALARSAVPVVVGLALAAPWFIRNHRTYGQVMPLRAFHAEFAQTSRAKDWIGTQPLEVDWLTGELRSGPLMDRQGYLALIAAWTARTYCAAYTPLNRATIGAPAFMPPTFYAIWWGLLAVGLAAGVASLARFARTHSGVRPYLVCSAVCIALVVASFVGFIWTYFQAQGRYLYPVLSPVSICWSLGMCSLARCEERRIAAPLVLGLLALLAAGFLFGGVIPAYGELRP